MSRKIGRARLAILFCAAAFFSNVVFTGVAFCDEVPPPPPANADEVEAPASPGTHTVYLDKCDRWQAPEASAVALKGILIRELMRQSLLIAARDEAGLETKDAWLGDDMPTTGDTEPLSVSADFGSPSQLTVNAGFVGARKPSSSIPLSVGQYSDYDAFISFAEGLSRNEYRAALKKCGFPITPNKMNATAEVSVEVEALLEEMNFISQFSAIRQLHGLIRKEGESPKLLGALVRGYANLGSLTEFHWHAAHKTFFARSLLYAQRMVARDANSAWAKRHMAYAKALTGLPGEALKELEGAEALGGDKDSLPSWTPAVEALCKFNAKKLGEMADADDSNAELGAYLKFLAYDRAQGGDMLVKTVTETGLKIPEAYRMYDAIGREGGVSSQHFSTTVGLETFGKFAYKRIAEMPGAPAAVKEICETPSETPPEASAVPLRPFEFTLRRRLMQALAAAADDKKVERAPGDEALSWEALGALIQDLSFNQSILRLHFETYSLAVSSDETLKMLRPLYIDHPLGFIISVYRSNAVAKEEAARKLEKIDFSDANVQGKKMLDVFIANDRNLKAKFEAAMTANFDSVEGDVKSIVGQIAGNKDGYLKEKDAGEKERREQYVMQFAHLLMRTSPYSPLARMAYVEYRWDEAAKDLKKWEEEASDHPRVLQVLSREYDRRKQNEDMVRCLKRAIESAPDFASYRMLANVYANQGKGEEYVRLLEESLKLPDYALWHGKINQDIAEHYMRKVQWSKALPYAEKAAETYSGWGLLCAAHCYERLKRWDEAEELYKACTLRYQGSEFNWYFFCKRTGKGALNEAKKPIANYLGRQQLKSSTGDLENSFSLSFFYVLEKQPEKALAVVRNKSLSGTNRWDAFWAASLADRLGDVETRDAAWKIILADEKSEKLSMPKEMIALANMMAEDANNKTSKIDLKEASEICAKLDATSQALFNYYLAKHLDMRKKKKDAIVFWKKSVGFPLTIEKFTHVLSLTELREHGVSEKEIDEARPKENLDGEKKPEEKKAEPKRSEKSEGDASKSDEEKKET